MSGKSPCGVVFMEDEEVVEIAVPRAAALRRASAKSSRVDDVDVQEVIVNPPTTAIGIKRNVLKWTFIGVPITLSSVEEDVYTMNNAEFNTEAQRERQRTRRGNTEGTEIHGGFNKIKKI